MHRLVLIDDHHIVREGFKRLFESDDQFVVVGEAAAALEGVKACHQEQPDLVMLDLSLGDSVSGLDVLPQILQVSPKTCVVIVSMHDDPALVARALNLGARGFISKAEGPALLVNLLVRVMNGEIITSSTPAQQRSRIELNERERDILRGIVADKPPKVIAYELGISDKTLYRQRANLLEKLGVRTPSSLARMAREHGWLIN